MAQRIYAVAADYYDFIGGDDPNEATPAPSEPIIEKDLDAKLRRASTVIDGLLRLAVYNSDDDGYPTDIEISEALQEATCAQAEWFDDTDDISGAESQAGPTRIGAVSFGGSGASGGASNTKNAATSRVAPEAVQILRNAGLLSSVISH